MEGGIAKRRKTDEGLQRDLFTLIAQKNPFAAVWGAHGTKWGSSNTGQAIPSVLRFAACHTRLLSSSGDPGEHQRAAPRLVRRRQQAPRLRELALASSVHQVQVRHCVCRVRPDGENELDFLVQSSSTLSIKYLIFFPQPPSPPSTHSSMVAPRYLKRSSCSASSWTSASARRRLRRPRPRLMGI